MIFLTLGTYPLPFDRLIREVDKLVEQNAVDEEIIAQIGYSNYIPKHIKYEKLMEKGKFDSVFASASALISHAGMGNISLALNLNKPLLVMPRRCKYGEVVNDHQVDTARKFEQLGHVLVAHNTEELPDKIKQIKTFIPKPRVPNRQGVIDRISGFLNTL